MIKIQKGRIRFIRWNVKLQTQRSLNMNTLYKLIQNHNKLTLSLTPLIMLPQKSISHFHPLA